MLSAEVVCIGDEHVGSTTGLMPKEGVTLKDDNEILPSAIQYRIAEFFDEFWARRRRSRLPKVIIRMGDGTEGRHHDSSQIWGRPADHLRALEQLYARPREMAAYCYSVDGTDCHVGEQGTTDEQLAERLGFEKVGGNYSNPHIRV